MRLGLWMETVDVSEKGSWSPVSRRPSTEKHTVDRERMAFDANRRLRLAIAPYSAVTSLSGGRQDINVAGICVEPCRSRVVALSDESNASRSGSASYDFLKGDCDDEESQTCISQTLAGGRRMTDKVARLNRCSRSMYERTWEAQTGEIDSLLAHREVATHRLNYWLFHSSAIRLVDFGFKDGGADVDASSLACRLLLALSLVRGAMMLSSTKSHRLEPGECSCHGAS